MAKKSSRVLKIGDQKILPGERKRFSLEAPRLYDFTEMDIPVEVIRGEKSGPTLFISAAVHGDEINGIEIIRRLLKKPALKEIKGTLIAIPIVNVFGFNSMSRYLPDRRDLNRCFPGKKEGSLGAILASTLMKEVIMKSTHGIDLHTGAIHRKNYPQIRGDMEDAGTLRMAQAFNAPATINARIRDGSLREACRRKNIPVLVFEGGEALRFDESIIKVGIKGCLSVMKDLGMIDDPKVKSDLKNCEVAWSSKWVRAPHSGLFHSRKSLGSWVKEGEVLGDVSDPYDRQKYLVKSTTNGRIIGMTQIPLISRGGALFNIASDQSGTCEVLDTEF